MNVRMRLSSIQENGASISKARVKYLSVTLGIYFDFLKRKLLVTHNNNTT